MKEMLVPFYILKRLGHLLSVLEISTNFSADQTLNVRKEEEDRKKARCQDRD